MFTYNGSMTMPESLSLDEILKMNPHLDRDEVQRMLDRHRESPNQPQAKRRNIVPDRLRVGDPSRARKVKLRYSL